MNFTNIISNKRSHPENYPNPNPTYNANSKPKP